MTHVAVIDQINDETMMCPEFPSGPWSTVGADLFKTDNRHYFVIVDYFSRLFEVAKLMATTSVSVIQHFKSIFTCYGIPEEVCSDNDSQFAS